MRRLAYKTKVMRTFANATAGAATEAQAASSNMAILQLIRFDPSTNTQRVESYQFHKGQDFMVLDLLTAVKAHQDPSLAFRASCCEGVCGSCAMNINGVNSLACVTYASPVTVVGPLPNFPVLKDMVVDLRGFFRQYEYIRPFVRNINLHRYHVDSIYDRYVKTCRALFGQPVKHVDEVAVDAGSGDSELIAYLRVLDRCVAVGDVSKSIAVIKKLKTLGYEIDNDKTKALLEEALKNFGK